MASNMWFTADSGKHKNKKFYNFENQTCSRCYGFGLIKGKKLPGGNAAFAHEMGLGEPCPECKNSAYAGGMILASNNPATPRRLTQSLSG